MKLADLIKQERFSSPSQQSLLNIIVTSSWVLGRFAATLAPYGLTPAQYNALRILRGSHPNPMTCSAIGDRLLDRTPDVTRLLNRLERSRFIERVRAGHDRRVVQVSLTEKGLDILQQLRPQMDDTIAELTKHLSENELTHLSDLLDRLRTDQA